MNSSELHTYRRSLGLTQGDLAKLLGVSRVTVNAWENGRTSVPSDIITRMANAQGAKQPERALNAQDREALANYTTFRGRGATHEHIMEVWRGHKYNVSMEARAAIAAKFPDILWDVRP